MTNFLERFKGKTSLMGRDGIPVGENDKPISKPLFISIVNEKEQSPVLKNQRINQFSQNLSEPLFKKPTRNFHSISSQSNKPSHFIQAAKNSIGMATYDFSPERNHSYFSGIEPKDPKMPYSASLFNGKAQKQRFTPLSASLEVKKEDFSNKPQGKYSNRLGNKGSDERKEKIKGSKIPVINEQNEEPEEDFEDLEKKHLQFLMEIEKMHFK